jgi:predicted permease
MEINHLSLGDSRQEATPRSSSRIEVGAVVFFFAIVELIFLRNLIALIRNHTPVYDLLSAFTFEAGMIAALIHYYAVCFGKQSVIRAGTRDTLIRNVSVLVMMMFLMLMMFSQVENAYHQIKP